MSDSSGAHGRRPPRLDTSALVLLRRVRIAYEDDDRNRRNTGAAPRSRSRLTALWRRYRFTAAWPLRLPVGTAAYLDELRAAGNKSGIMAREMCEAGLPRAALYPPNEGHDRVGWRRALRRLVRLPRAMALDLHLRRRHPWLTEDEVATLIGRDSCVRFLRRHPSVWLLLNSDMSPRRLILAGAAAAVGSPAVWWQDDIDHVPPRIPFAAAALLNDAARKRIHAVDARTAVFQRPVAPPVRVRQIPSSPVVGVAVNAFFTAEPAQLELLDAAREAIGVDRLKMRLHPRTSPDLRAALPDWLDVYTAAEPVEAFGARVDVALVGNSAVQVRLLASGVPVVHIPGLDPHGFDGYGYAARGIVCGTERVAPNTLDAARRFYSSPAYFALLTSELSQASEEVGQGLSDLVRIVVGDPGMAFAELGTPLAADGRDQRGQLVEPP
jgi:hypothetical protein